MTARPSSTEMQFASQAFRKRTLSRSTRANSRKSKMTGISQLSISADLAYHFSRASMVQIFLFFGYQKWFDYEAKVSFRTSAMALLSRGCIRRSASGCLLVSRHLRMAIWLALVLRILEQEAGHSWCAWLMRFVRGNHHDYSVLPEWPGGVGRWISHYDRRRRFSDEGCCSFSRVGLFAQTGWPRAGDEDVHQPSGALLPIRAGLQIGDADQSPK